MTELFAISAQANVLSAAAVVSQQTPPAPAPSRVAPEATPSQVSPETSLNVTPETIAAIQSLGGNESDGDGEEERRIASENQPKSYQELQAEARRWERYYAHQPRRLADLLAVYYGDHPASVDPRGPVATSPASEDDGPETGENAVRD